MDVFGREWMAKMWLYWSGLCFGLVSSSVAPSFAGTVGTGEASKGVRLVVEALSGVSEMEVEAAERAIAIASVIALAAG